jgi:hypothetical protein
MRDHRIGDDGTTPYRIAMIDPIDSPATQNCRCQHPAGSAADKS